MIREGVLPSHDQARNIAHNRCADEDGTDLRFGKINSLGRAADDDKGGAERSDGQSCSYNKRLDSSIAETSKQQGVAQADGEEDADGRSTRAQEEVGLEKPKMHGQSSLEDDEDEADVTQAHKGLLPLDGHDVTQRYAVDETDQHLTDEACLEDLVGDPFCECEKEEEGDDDQKLGDCRY